MTEQSPSNRSYNSSRRQQQARQTRAQITEAARKLFTERGYAGATLGAIADEAGVAVETIYATFGSKRALLSHLVNTAVTGADDSIPLLERAEIRATMQEASQHQQVRQFSGQMRAIMSRMAPIFEVIRTAAKSEADIAELREGILAERRQGMRYFLQALVSHGPLNSGLSLDEAADQVFALSSGEMFNVLTLDLGWSQEHYERWLEETLIALLLPPGAIDSRHQVLRDGDEGQS